MRFEDQSTNCPGCKGPLTLLSHIRRWEEPQEVHEFEFRCEACKHDYLYKEGQFTSKTHERDVIAEGEGIRHAESQSATNRRCSQCGGPITGQGGAFVRCEWCHQEYEVNSGELQLRPDRPQVKPTLREFADALHEKR